MKKIYFFLIAMLAGFAGVAQQNFWKDASESEFSDIENRRITPNNYRTLKLDTLALKQFLADAPMEFSADAKKRQHVLSLPLPTGGFGRFAIVESPMMEPGLAINFPNIKTYGGQGIDDPTATIKIDWTDFGFHAMVLSKTSGQMFVDPFSMGNKTDYMAYARTDLSPKPFQEIGVLEIENQANLAAKTTIGVCLGSTLRVYRLALACTGEYAAFFGGTVNGALSGMVTTMNRVNGVYETEVAIRMVLIANNNILIQLNAATDGYTNNDGVALLTENQNKVNGMIGSANYDIGHVFSTGGGGIAARGSVCDAGNKARGVTGSDQPTGDAFDIDYVAHEMGHQFNGNHTFNANSGGGSCTNGTRNPGTAVEPGSGVTIMGYAGICGTADIASNSIPYFHAASFNEIGIFRTSGAGTACGTVTNTGNTPPVVIDAGNNVVIPKGTPFVLKGQAVDANGDVLTYSWEETDPGTSGGNWNSGNKPFFRSFPPVTNSERYFPKLSALATSTTSIGEMLPQSSQALNFRLTARDNRAGGGGVCFTDIVITVANVGPFSITSQWGPETWTANGTNQATISWSVASTNTAPINVSHVDILFSTDGGLTWPYIIKSNTPNDGSESITVPAVATTNGRVMVKARDNVFFNINDAAITVNVTSCPAEGAIVTPSSTVTADAGSTQLNLNLSPSYSGPFSANGSITSTDPAGNTSILNTQTNSCMSAGSGGFRHDLYPFTVTQTGSYTFTHNGQLGVVTNIYQGSFNPTSACTNFVASNVTYNGSQVLAAPSVSATLTAGTNYVLAVGSYSTTQPTLPAAYNVVATPPAGGAVQSSGGYTNPGAGYTYSYVIVNNFNNTIASIASSANLSNPATYPSGSFTVYGISYASTSAATINSYVGQNFNNLSSAIIANPTTLCANLSKNTVSVNIQAVMPVTFLALKATKLPELVRLDWGTAAELNSERFVVERSANGGDFVELSWQKAAGNSSTPLYYRATDNSPVEGTSFYRIKEVDFDGNTTYSNVVSVTYHKGGNMIMIYPNPATDRLTVEMHSVKLQTITMQVMDAKGAMVSTNTQALAAGTNQANINISNLSKGVYVLKITEADGTVKHSRFVKQ